MERTGSYGTFYSFRGKVYKRLIEASLHIVQSLPFHVEPKDGPGISENDESAREANGEPGRPISDACFDDHRVISCAWIWMDDVPSVDDVSSVDV